MSPALGPLHNNREWKTTSSASPQHLGERWALHQHPYSHGTFPRDKNLPSRQPWGQESPECGAQGAELGILLLCPVWTAQPEKPSSSPVLRANKDPSNQDRVKSPPWMSLNPAGVGVWGGWAGAGLLQICTKRICCGRCGIWMPPPSRIWIRQPFGRALSV